MNAREVLEKAQDAMTARIVYGDPYERDGVSVIPAAAVRGGGGGGGEGESGGGGFGLSARPVGAFVISGDDVRWRPVVDVERLFLGACVAAVAFGFTVRSVRRVGS